LIQDARVWRCTDCGGTSNSADMPLRDEEELSRRIPDAMQGAPETACDDAHALGQLREHAARTVGTMHWTWALTTFAWLQKCLVQLRSEPVIYFGELELGVASTAVSRWLQACCFENVKQRASALFIAVRLADDLGGHISKWGYDPDDLLGGSFRAAACLAEHGWRLKGGHVEWLGEPRS